MKCIGRLAAPVKVELPGGGDQNPVDAFVRAKLQQLNISSSPSAEPGVLCRRLYLDVIGLPPHPQELKAFEARGLSGDARETLGE